MKVKLTELNETENRLLSELVGIFYTRVRETGMALHNSEQNRAAAEAWVDENLAIAMATINADPAIEPKPRTNLCVICTFHVPNLDQADGRGFVEFQAALRKLPTNVN